VSVELDLMIFPNPNPNLCAAATDFPKPAQHNVQRRELFASHRSTPRQRPLYLDLEFQFILRLDSGSKSMSPPIRGR